MNTFLKVMFFLLSLMGFLLIGISIYFFVTPANPKDIIFQINTLALSIGLLYLTFVVFLWEIYKDKTHKK
ncbi:MAG: hypothetical protein J7K98_02520 [Candidatus Aenigmarchaeota archaeon]|nr:hypothetical protein [Candidatus Aenigmarchaeota archaeon]